MEGRSGHGGLAGIERGELCIAEPPQEEFGSASGRRVSLGRTRAVEGL